MRDLSRNEAIGLITLLLGLTVLFAWTFLKTSQAVATSGIALRDTFTQAPAAPPPIGPQDASVPAGGNEAGEIVVHVAGAVRKPGVYHLRPGARGEDALRAAGGPTSNANTDAINLAARLEDGLQLYFPTRAEHPGGADLPAPSRTASTASRSRSGSRSNKLTSPDQGVIDINSAGAEELQRIPGVGPGMAERLLTYRRAHHGFRRVEDLLNVGGIGAKKYAKMKGFVRVGSTAEAVDTKNVGGFKGP